MDVLDGRWRLAVESPLGRQDFALDLTEQDGALTGKLTNLKENVSTDVFDGSVQGDQLRWKVKLQQVRLTLTFTTTVRDDLMTGQVKAGLFGHFAVTGHRG